MRTGTVAALQASFVRAAGREIVFVERTPQRIACDSTLVADPPHVWSGIAEKTRVRLKRTHKVPGSGPVVIGIAIDRAPLTSAAVVSVSAICAVEKDLENRTIRRQQFAQLIAEVVQVFRTAIIFMVAIPRRQIDAKLQSVLAACFGNLTDHVAPAVAPRAVL